MSNTAFLANYGDADHLDSLISGAYTHTNPTTQRIVIDAFRHNPMWNDSHTDKLAHVDTSAYWSNIAPEVKTHSTINHLMKHAPDDYRLRRNLADNPHLSDEHIHKIIDIGDEDDFTPLCWNPNLKPEHVKKMMPKVRSMNGTFDALMSRHMGNATSAMDKDNVDALLKTQVGRDQIQQIKRTPVYKKFYPNGHE